MTGGVPGHLISTADIIDASGITSRQADFWTRRGYLRTYSSRRPGSANARIYLPGEAAVATIMGRLVAVDGLTPALAERIARSALTNPRVDLAPGITIEVTLTAEVVQDWKQQTSAPPHAAPPRTPRNRGRKFAPPVVFDVVQAEAQLTEPAKAPPIIRQEGDMFFGGES